MAKTKRSTGRANSGSTHWTKAQIKILVAAVIARGSEKYTRAFWIETAKLTGDTKGQRKSWSAAKNKWDRLVKITQVQHLGSAEEWLDGKSVKCPGSLARCTVREMKKDNESLQSHLDKALQPRRATTANAALSLACLSATPPPAPLRRSARLASPALLEGPPVAA